MVYSWSIGKKPRDPITVFPAGEGLGIKNLTLSNGSKIEVHLAPLRVDDDQFVQSLTSGGIESDIKLICLICTKWGDQDFVVPEDLQNELDAVRDVSGAINRYFPQRAEIIEEFESAPGDNLPPKRGKLR